MIALLKRWGAGASLGLPQPDAPTFIIGDVHGRIDLLDQLLKRCPAHAENLVFLGDIVDRGEESARALERVKALCDAEEGTVCLRGNHEEMLIDFLKDPQGEGPRWLKCGGLQTLASYGVRGLSPHSTGEALDVAAASLEAAMTPELIEWIRTRQTFWQSGTLVAVHAAADPNLPMDAQREDSLLWGHSGFMSAPRSDGLWVAHGHTVMNAPIFEQSRISLDTGAYYTGRLSAAMVEPDGSVAFITSMD